MTLLLVALLTATPVMLTVADCPLSPGEVKRIAELELDRGPETALPVSLRCTANDLTVTVDDPVTGKTLARRFPLRSMPARGAERYAAVAIAELVQASWSELLLPAPEVPRAPLSPTETRAAVETLPVQRVRLSALGLVRGWPTAGLVQFGAGLRGHVTIVGPVGMSAELCGESGRRTVAGGSVSADALGAAVFATLQGRPGPVLLLFGLGARGFGARLVGLPDDPMAIEGRTVSAFLLGPAAIAEVSIAFGRFEVNATLDGGVLPRGLEGRTDGATVAGLWGGWLGGTLGVGWRW